MSGGLGGGGELCKPLIKGSLSRSRKKRLMVDTPRKSKKKNGLPFEGAGLREKKTLELYESDLSRGFSRRHEQKRKRGRKGEGENPKHPKCQKRTTTARGGGVGGVEPWAKKRMRHTKDQSVLPGREPIKASCDASNRHVCFTRRTLNAQARDCEKIKTHRL